VSFSLSSAEDADLGQALIAVTFTWVYFWR
jgi:hypothetical protein